MRKATLYDKEKVVEILTRQFKIVPGTIWMLRKGKAKQKGLKNLSTFAFYKVLARNGVYIANNGEGIALCYKYNYHPFSFREIVSKIHFILTAIDIRCIPKLCYLENYKKKLRPKSGNYLYFWFFAVLKGGKNAGFELKNGIFKMAKKMNLSIYAETSMQRNKFVYERYGFKTYHFYFDPDLNLKYWFMRYDP